MQPFDRKAGRAFIPTGHRMDSDHLHDAAALRARFDNAWELAYPADMKCIALLGLLSSSLYAAELPLHVATTPVARTDADGLERTTEVLENAREARDAQIVFLGDSITELWRADDAGGELWEKHWKPLKAVNFGVGGDRTEHVLWRIDHGQFDGLSPRVIVLLIGTNNSGQQFEPGGYRCTAEQTADGIRAILDRLHKQCPAAKIVLHALFPRGEENTDRAWQQNEKTNQKIATFADGKHVTYLDVGGKFLKANGDPDITLMPDLLHLSAKGYRLWSDALLPVVRGLLAP